jgi:hemerythrin-like domain-containing protein
LLDPFEDLEADHRVIDKVLTALEAARPRNTDQTFFYDVVNFVRAFADGCHHDKEENFLFPALEDAGIQRTMGPVGVMLDEHKQARRFVERMERLLESGDLASLCQEGYGYAAVMRDHIYKEEQALFMMGRGMLSPECLILIGRGFETIGSACELRAFHDEIAIALCVQVGVEPVATLSASGQRQSHVSP